MARDVYFDPFGSSLEGYRKGINDEAAMLKGAEDIQQLRNETELSNASLPIQKQMLPIGLERAENNLFLQNRDIADEFARRYRVTEPSTSLAAEYFGLPTTSTDNSLAFHSPETGEAIGVVADPDEALYDYLIAPRVTARAKFLSSLRPSIGDRADIIRARAIRDRIQAKYSAPANAFGVGTSSYAPVQPGSAQSSAIIDRMFQ